MMEFIQTLLNGNFATVISVLIAVALIAFTWYVALPAITERNQLREQLKEAPTHSPERVENLVERMSEELASVTQQMTELSRVLAEMQAHATVTSRADGTAQAELYTLLDEIRQQLHNLATRFVNLTNTVNAMGGQRQVQRSPESLDVRGLR